MSAKNERAETIGLVIAGVFGSVYMLQAANVIAVSDEHYTVPRWVAFLGGLVFVLPGLAKLLSADPRWSRYAITALMVCLGLLGIGTGLTTDESGFDDGPILPFISEETDLLISRVLFVMGGITCLVMAMAHVRGAWHSTSEQHNGGDDDE